LGRLVAGRRSRFIVCRLTTKVELILPQLAAVGVTLLGLIAFRLGGADASGCFGRLLARNAALLSSALVAGPLQLRALRLRQGLPCSAGRKRAKWADVHGFLSRE
jgi:hypothetical protein